MANLNQTVVLTADADHSIVALGTPLQFTFHAEASGGVDISPAGDIVVNAGEQMTFIVTAQAGFRIASILVDGVEVAVP